MQQMITACYIMPDCWLELVFKLKKDHKKQFLSMNIESDVTLTLPKQVID